MNDDGDTKDDVKMPDGEIGDKITKLFKTEEKDTSKSTVAVLSTQTSSNFGDRRCYPDCHG